MRVVSLVPSATESLIALGVTPVACTRFCEQPGLPTVGGTKNPNVNAIVALEPDVVVVNDEENRREDADALVAAGITVHSMSPRAVGEVAPALAALAAAVGCAAPSFDLPPAETVRGTAVALIWRRPWMTQRTDTYGSSVLEHLGWSNPFGVGSARYLTIELSDLARESPDLVVLPSEPYPFTDRHGGEINAGVPGTRVGLVDGRDLFWWGTRTGGALARLAESLD